MSKVSVLLELGSSRKEIYEERDELVYTIEKELEQVGKNGILAYFSCERGYQSLTKDVYILQRWAVKWEAYVDVTDLEQIEDGDRLTIIHQQQEDRSTSRSSRASFDTTQGQKLTSQASKACGSLKTLNQSHAQAMAKLFPSSSTSSLPRRSEAFDPTAQCIAYHWQKQKKGSPRLKPSKITFALVHHNAKGIPRGRHRKTLQDNKRIIKINILRTMTPKEINRAVLSAFEHHDLKSFQYQSIDPAHHFKADSEQEKDGSTIVDNGAKGTIYIKELCDDLTADDSTELPPATFLYPHSKSPDVVIVDENNGGDNAHSNQVTDQSLEEFRQTRAIQDKAYEESLAIDIQKIKRADEIKELHEKRLQLQQNLILKYAHPATDGVTIAFRLLNGEKVSYVFSVTDVTKRLYEFVFSKATDVDLSFKLSKAIPLEDVVCSDTVTLSAVDLSTSCTLVVKEDDGDVLNLLIEQEDAEANDGIKSDTQVVDIIEMVDAKRIEFVKTVCPVKPIIPHIIRRSNIFIDVLNLFQNKEALKQFPLWIHFQDEMGFDSGGVCRDMFSGFWEEAYLKFFDGSSLLTPVLHATMDMTRLPLLGKIMSHGFLVSGYLPVCVAFPSLAAILLGPMIEIPLPVLVETFAESLCCYEAAIIKDALQSEMFSSDLKAKVIGILSRFGSRVCPSTGQQLRAQLADVAKYEFIMKPMAAITGIHGGISSEEKAFWNGFSVSQLHNLYFSLSATPSKVLNIIVEPLESNSCQARIFGYLQQYVGNMRNEEVRRFLRFTTGSAVLIAEKITISFNSLTGAARRPIARTCACILELSSTYETYMEFEHEFTLILADDDYSWAMNAI